jgi:flagellar basal body-associated protein FliL
MRFNVLKFVLPESKRYANLPDSFIKRKMEQVIIINIVIIIIIVVVVIVVAVAINLYNFNKSNIHPAL